MTMNDPIKHAIAQLICRRELSPEVMAQTMEQIMDGLATSAQIGAFLAASRTKGETPTEIATAAKVLRSRAEKIRPSRPVLDTCGTGGDASGTFNISTASAFVLAGAGVPVAKHGNRSVSSSCGSADVLEALGVEVNLPAAAVLTCIEEIGIGFLFAPTFHRALSHAAQARKEIGFRSLFNLVGPLVNPAGASYQVVGVYDRSLTETLAVVLGELSLREAMVVAGLDGLDELSPCAPSVVSHLVAGEVRTFEISPEEAGLERVDPAALVGGDAPVNARIVRKVLDGSDRGSCRAAVLLNAAAGFVVTGRTRSWPEAVALGEQSIDSGRAVAKLDALVRKTIDLAAQRSE